MIIGISGKIGSGKDTVGSIIQYLTDKLYYKSDKSLITYDDWLAVIKEDDFKSDWKIKKFAGKLKEIVSLLTGYSLEDLERQEIKDTVLGEEWKRFFFTGRIDKIRIPKSFYGIHSNEEDALEAIQGTNHLDLASEIPTVRTILQEVGTDAMRNVVHPNIWINALMSDYRPIFADPNFKRKSLDDIPPVNTYPNWIITDVRFENEAQAILDKGGILIRVERMPGQLLGKAVTKKEDGNGEYIIDEHCICDVPIPKEHYGKVITTQDFKIAYPFYSNHPSETALDNYKGFRYRIKNNGTIDDLVEQVRYILAKEKIISYA